MYVHYYSKVEVEVEVGKHFFERSLFCSPRLHLFDQKYIKKLKYYYNLK